MLFLTLIAILAVVYSGYTPYWYQNWSPACCEERNTNDNCECNYGTCSWWGDPHTQTFDGLWHHFQGFAGTRYRYVSPCNSDFLTVPFQVLATHRACGWNNQYGCTDTVDIRLHNIFSGNYEDTIRIDNGYFVSLYTEPTVGPNLADGRYSYGSGSWFTVHRYPGWVEVSIYTGELCSTTVPRPDLVIKANNNMGRVEVNLNDYYKRYVCGICGFWSDLQCDDLAVAWNIQGRDVCYQFDQPSTPYMGSYTWQDWWRVEWFGWYWQDWGIGIRRLQSIGEPDENTLPDGREAPDRDDIDLPRRVNEARLLNACEDIFPDIDCQHCVDEVIARWNECPRGTNRGQRCIRRFCPDLIPFDEQDPNQQTFGAATAADDATDD